MLDMSQTTFVRRTRSLQAALVLVSLTSCFLTTVTSTGAMAFDSKRYKGPSIVPDIPLPKEMEIYNQTVTCGYYPPGKFVSTTYTCGSMKVGGRHLAYGYYPGWEIGKRSAYCQETKGVHEFSQLCVKMLEAVNVTVHVIRAVYIPQSHCGYLSETRKLLRKTSRDTFAWTDFPPGLGWTETIQCMIDL